MHLLLSITFFLQNDRYPINGTEYTVPLNGSELQIDISKDGVPIEAYEVTLYVTISSGDNEDVDRDGHFVFSTSTTNGNFERLVKWHAYPQAAWSFNSENIALPVGRDRTVRAKIINNHAYKRLTCKAKLIEYRKPPT